MVMPSSLAAAACGRNGSRAADQQTPTQDRPDCSGNRWLPQNGFHSIRDGTLSCHPPNGVCDVLQHPIFWMEHIFLGQPIRLVRQRCDLRCSRPQAAARDSRQSMTRITAKLAAVGRDGSWLRKNVSERSKAASDWLASTLKRADWLFLRSRGLETPRGDFE